MVACTDIESIALILHIGAVVWCILSLANYFCLQPRHDTLSLQFCPWPVIVYASILYTEC